MRFRRYHCKDKELHTTNFHEQAHMWNRLNMTVLHAEYRAERSCRLPDSLGPMLRGALGYALKPLACFSESDRCEPCPAWDRCAFGALYNTTESATSHDHPVPYVLTPPLDGRRELAARDTIEFMFTLVGSGRVWLPWVIAALSVMGRQGWGEDRHPFLLSRLRAEGPPGHMTDLRVQSAGIGEPIRELASAALISARPYRESVVLHFLTPADIRKDGRLIEFFDGPTLIGRLLRRIGSLAEHYGGWSAEGFDFPAILGESSAMICSDRGLHPYQTERFSTRQDRRHPLAGLMGRVELSCISPTLWPYLVLGERLHVGKGASFGMGKYVIEDVTLSPPLYPFVPSFCLGQ